MAKKGGRRTVSINEELYERFQERCWILGLSLSGVVEKWVQELDENGLSFVPRVPSKITLSARIAEAMQEVRGRSVEISHDLFDRLHDRVVFFRANDPAETKLTTDTLLDRILTQILDGVGAPRLSKAATRRAAP